MHCYPFFVLGNHWHGLPHSPVTTNIVVLINWTRKFRFPANVGIALSCAIVRSGVITLVRKSSAHVLPRLYPTSRSIYRKIWELNAMRPREWHALSNLRHADDVSSLSMKAIWWRFLPSWKHHGTIPYIAFEKPTIPRTGGQHDGE
jgi:hypothetical protein